VGSGARGTRAFLVVCMIGLAWFANPGLATPGVDDARGGAAVPYVQQRGLTFTDHTGRAVSERDFSGRYMLVFFGYTHCPDVCPGNLAIMAAAMRELGSMGEFVQPLFITFDPERDTPEVLAEYVPHFHPRLMGLTGSFEEIAAAARSYGVLFERNDAEEGATASEYSLRHTARTYLIGPDGKGVAIFEHDSNAKEMAAEILGVLERDRVLSSTGGL